MRFDYGLRRRSGQRLLAALGFALCLGAFAASRPAQAAPLVHLLIFGDSLTSGYGLPIQDGFQARLAAALQAAGANVALVDGAVTGDTTENAAARLDWVLAGGPVDAAFIEIGGNDGLQGLDTDAMDHNLTRILDVLAADHVPVLLSGMLAPPSLGADYCNRFKAVFTRLSQRPGILFDPFFLQGIAGNPALVQADGIHPNAAGVTFEVNRLLPLILRLVAEAKPAS